MASKGHNPALRPFLPQDAALCAAIAEASITELTAEDYTEAQQEAWIAAVADEDSLRQKLAGQLTLIASLGGAPVGFVSLKGNDRLDMIYVHPGAAGQGVGSALCDAVEKLAGARGTARLTVDASDTAQSFFAKRGYVAQQRNTLPLGDEWLGNTTMTKELATGQAGKATQ